MSESAERVARGAAWLDEVAPGWERKLDLSVLDISNIDQCVCGQVFMGLDALGISGFGYAERELWGPTMRRDFGEYGFAYSEDGDTWVALVKERFDSGLLSDAQ